MNYPEGMDLECIPLCDALNKVKGIRTFESCCGHGDYKFVVFFFAETMDALKVVTKATHSTMWMVEVHYPISLHNNLVFVLESKRVDGAIEDSNRLAKYILDYIDDEGNLLPDEG